MTTFGWTYPVTISVVFKSNLFQAWSANCKEAWYNKTYFIYIWKVHELHLTIFENCCIDSATNYIIIFLKVFMWMIMKIYSFLIRFALRTFLVLLFTTAFIRRFFFFSIIILKWHGWRRFDKFCNSLSGRKEGGWILGYCHIY